MFAKINSAVHHVRVLILAQFCLGLTVFGCSSDIQDKSGNGPVREHIQFLADEEHSGRLAGTPGEAAAANYISDQFLGAGLLPAGDKGTYLQQFVLEGPMPQAMETENFISRNVVGFVEGAALNGQYIIIGAHYDSQGTGGIISMEQNDEPAIHPGADDNASGIAGLLELAKHFADTPIQKNMLFIAFSGEELGLLGSRHFIDQMEISPDSVAAMINLDMIGRLTNNSLTIFGTGTSNKWDEILEAADADSLIITRSPSGTGASDHTSFYESEIAVLHYFTGTHENYHRPGDTADKINVQGIRRVADHIIEVAETLDNYDATEIGFRESTNPHSATFDMDGPTLGVLPDYAYSGDGFRIQGVRTGEPAEQGGMQDGDVITQMGETDISDIYDYMDKLSDIEEGDQLILTVRRDGQDVRLDIQF